jgi:hypothetical protein
MMARPFSLRENSRKDETATTRFFTPGKEATVAIHARISPDHWLSLQLDCRAAYRRFPVYPLGADPRSCQDPDRTSTRLKPGLTTCLEVTLSPRCKERTRMAVVRQYTLNILAVLVLLCACSPASFGLTTSGPLGRIFVAAGSRPDPSVLVLIASALTSFAYCQRIHRRTKTGS